MVITVSLHSGICVTQIFCFLFYIFLISLSLSFLLFNLFIFILEQNMGIHHKYRTKQNNNPKTSKTGFYMRLCEVYT